MNDHDFIIGAAAWAARTEASDIDTGLEWDVSLARAGELLHRLREQGAQGVDAELDEAMLDVLNAACYLVARPEATDLRETLDDARNLFHFMETAKWPSADLGERAELLAECAFAAWRIARKNSESGETEIWLSKSQSAARTGHLQVRVEAILEIPITERFQNAAEFHLDEPDTLLAILSDLPRSWDAAPAKVLEEAVFLYGYLEKLEVRQTHDPILPGEREYFLGESARIAGTAARFLSRRDQARDWFDLAEAWFLATENASANIARLGYQRLALRVEERDFDAVTRLLPHLVANFDRLSMPDDALKARFLEAIVQKETGKFAEATKGFESIIEIARAIPNEVLHASAYANLVQIHGFLGDADAAARCAGLATPVLRALKNHVALAKIQWGLGHLLKARNQVLPSIEAFRQAQREFREIEMHADVAAVHLILADLLLDANQPAQAEWEIRAALPIIEEYKLVPEGIAAYSLLRDSLRRRQIDRQALRNLHGYFRES